MFKTEDAAYAYQDGQWVKSDMQPASDAFEITREGDAFTVLQDGEPIYTDREMQTLCIMDDAAAYERRITRSIKLISAQANILPYAMSKAGKALIGRSSFSAPDERFMSSKR